MASREHRGCDGRWVVFVLLAYAACSGGSMDGSRDGGGSAPYTFATSVDGGVSLTDLTASQAAQLCADISAANAGPLQATYCSAFNQASAVDDARTYLGGNPGASSADLESVCLRYLMGANAGSCPMGTTCDATRIAASPAACTATVGDVVACINENAAIAQELLNTTPSCASITASSLSRYFADGGAFDTYGGVSMSGSCEALVSCYGISTPSGGTP